MNNKILQNIDNYYTTKIIENGATPKGVDWNSIESQELRFSILAQILASKENFSILDFGCGFGSMYEFYMKNGIKNFKYTGYDISKQMIIEAKNKYKANENLVWCNNLNIELEFDYVIASGIFNVKLEENNDDWLIYILDTLKLINQKSKKGFSFNILTKYSDKEHMRDYLFYADPLMLFDYCKSNFSKYVTLIHDYPLYEFTIIVRK